MKVNNPRSRFNLAIPPSARVLDVGSGHNPHPRANVVMDKFIDSNYHRKDKIKILNAQEFVEGDGEHMPFKLHEFDYVICCHVLEHVEHPATFLGELQRVARAGYIETPSLVGELLIPKASHKWVLLEIKNKIVMVDKSRLGFHTSNDLGALFLDYLPKHSLAFKILQRTQPQLFTVNYEWKDSIEFEVDPSDEELKRFFTEPWDDTTCSTIVPSRSMLSECASAAGASFDIFRSVIKSKILKSH